MATQKTKWMCKWLLMRYVLDFIFIAAKRIKTAPKMNSLHKCERQKNTSVKVNFSCFFLRQATICHNEYAIFHKYHHVAKFYGRKKNLVRKRLESLKRVFAIMLSFVHSIFKSNQFVSLHRKRKQILRAPIEPLQSQCIVQVSCEECILWL